MVDGPLASFAGLATGIDTDSLIAGLLSAERAPVRRLQAKQADLNSISGRLKEINGRLNNIKDAAESLKDVDDFRARRISSESNSYFTASASGTATPASYQIYVGQLAQAQVNVSDGFNDKEAALGISGDLDITIDGTTTSISISATDTLENIASNLNENLGDDVDAAVIFDGTDYRLRVAAEDTNELIDYDETGLSGGTFDFEDSANALIDAQGASITIDGLAITSDTNSITDAIPGVTINLTQAHDNSTDTNPLTVAADTDAIVDKIDNFVSNYNALAEQINREMAFSGQARIGDSLSGDFTLRTIQTQLRGIIVSPIDGLSGDYSLLADVGIETTQNGLIEVDKTALKEALAADPDAVADLFIDNTDNSTEGIFAQLEAEIATFTTSSTGTLTQRISGIANEISDIDDRIIRVEERLDRYSTQLRRQFTAMEQAVSNLQSQGSQFAAMLGQLG